MSANNLVFINGQFYYDGVGPYSPSYIGRDIVNTLLRGAPYTEFGPSADFAMDVLRQVGRTGKFHFILDDERSPFSFEVEEARALQANAATVGEVGTELKDSGTANGDVHEDLGGLRVSDSLTRAAHKIRSTAGKLLTSLHGDGPLVGTVTLPTIKCSDPKIGAEAVWYDPTAKVWNFGGYQVGVNKLGRLIALSLIQGHEWVKVGEFEVTVNYLAEMVKSTREKGAFVDYNDNAFDPNAPRNHAA